MQHNKVHLLRVNAEIIAACSFEFPHTRDYIHCDMAAEYAHTKNEFIRLHERAFHARGSRHERQAFASAYRGIVDRMRSMHTDLITTMERAQNEITITDAKHDDALKLYEEEQRKGLKIDYRKFLLFFKEHVRWTTDAEASADVSALQLAIISNGVGTLRRQGYESMVHTWISPHKFELYLKSGSGKEACDRAKLRAHTAFQSLLMHAKTPNATVAWSARRGMKLCLWDAGLIFCSNDIAPKLPDESISSLEFDAQLQMFKLSMGNGPVLRFGKLPTYSAPAQHLPDSAVFHHAFLLQLLNQQPDDALEAEIRNWSDIVGLLSDLDASHVSPRLFSIMLYAFDVVQSGKQ